MGEHFYLITGQKNPALSIFTFPPNSGYNTTMAEIIKHLFLSLFFLAFALSIGLAVYSHLKGSKKIGIIFFSFGLFMFFWYISSYLVLNITHEDTILYTTFEVCAFISALAGLFQFTKCIIHDKLGIKIKPLFHSLLFILPGILFILAKYSHYIWGYHPPAFYYIKQAAFWFLITLYIGTITILVIKKKSPFSLLGILLPIALILDTWVIRDKFYTGQVNLSMNYPILVSIYLLFIIIYTIHLVKNRHTDTQQPEKMNNTIEDFCEKLNITPREKEIINLIVLGKSNQAIGDTLFISLGTVKNHIHNIYRKCGITSRFELISLVKGEKSPDIPQM